MTTASLKQDVDRLWEKFWTGGITNPLTVIEQISFLVFARMLDMSESRNERRWNRKNPGKKFPGELFDARHQHLRWKDLKQDGDAERLMATVRDELFPHMRELAGKDSAFGKYLKDAQLMILKPGLLREAIEMIDKLPLGKSDTKGNLYEYMLGKLTSAGIAGQFRTPRHIIDLMVAMVDPKPTETVCDPACGTAGFLVQTIEYLMKKYSSKDGILDHLDENGEPVPDEDGKPGKLYTGDLLEPYRAHINSGMLHGFDFDITMLRIAAMNLLLHDIDNPSILYQDTLNRSFRDKYPDMAEEHFDVILANPPFKGMLDLEGLDPSITGKVKTKKSELLFVALIHQMLLAPGGRAAVIVPDGVLFGSSNAHVALRQMLVEENTLQGVVSLPSGVFNPYAGVSTTIQLFTRGGTTEDVFFYKLENDGFSLDDKRARIEDEDMSDCLERWEEWQKKGSKMVTARTDKAFLVPKAELVENEYDLSINRYQEVDYEESKTDKPKDILKSLAGIENTIAKDLKDLEKLLG